MDMTLMLVILFVVVFVVKPRFYYFNNCNNIHLDR